MCGRREGVAEACCGPHHSVRLYTAAQVGKKPGGAVHHRMSLGGEASLEVRVQLRTPASLPLSRAGQLAVAYWPVDSSTRGHGCAGALQTWSVAMIGR